jgi:hypothetical protein
MKPSFMSHGWCDAAIVSQFSQKVEERGLAVFLDKWNLSSGQMIWATIDRAIDDAEKLVLFLSRDALIGKGVKEEIDRGLQKAYEKQGEAFIIPVALDSYDDISPLLPIRVRGANMIRAFDQTFDESVAQLDRAIRGEPIPRQAVNVPTDFYCRFYGYANALVIEVGSGIQAQNGFAVEILWNESVLFKNEWGMNPPGTPNNIRGFAMITGGPEQHLPKTPDTRLCASIHNESITRHQSFYFAVSTPDSRCPSLPNRVRLFDRFGKVIRERLPQFTMGLVKEVNAEDMLGYCFIIHA